MVEAISLYETKEFIQRFKSGDAKAFEHIFRQCYERLYWFGRRFISDPQDVEDILSEAYLKVWKRRQYFDTIDSVKAFLHVAIRNQCFDLLKQQQIKTEYHRQLLNQLSETEVGDFSMEDLQVELVKKIFSQIERLPPKMREIFLLSYQEGLKPAAIAKKMGLNVQTVKNQKVTALKIIKSALSNEPSLVLLIVLMERLFDA